MSDSLLPSDIARLARALANRPDDGGDRLLDFAQVLRGRGEVGYATLVEEQALSRDEPALLHRWRREQAARAPANQFLLLNEPLRTEAFTRAIQAAVAPGSRVLEIGTGSAILALLAARAGAGEVVTCEHQPMMASIAREIVRANGFEAVVRVLAKDANELVPGQDLPEQVDVLVADLFTGSLLEAAGLPLLGRARQRFLAPGGRIVPAAGALRACLVGGPAIERLSRVGMVDGFDLSHFNRFSPPVIPLQHERVRGLALEEYSEDFECFAFDFQTLEGFRPRQRRASLRCLRNGVVSGLLQWVQLDCGAGAMLDPRRQAQLPWPQYLHVFPEPQAVETGGTLAVRLEHDLVSFSAWPVSSADDLCPGQSLRP